MSTELIKAPQQGVQAQPDFNTMLERFAAYINVKAVTAASYGVCLRHFAEWINDNGIKQPQRSDILQYSRYLAAPHPRRQRSDRNSSAPAPVIIFSAGTQARYLRAVKMFFKWTANENLYPDVASNIKGAKVRADNSKRDAFEKQDIVKLLNSIDRSTPAGKRDFAMILLSVTAGLRCIEMQRANIGNIETIYGEKVLFIQGKGHDEADQYKKLPPEVYAVITEYLQTRKHTEATAPLFAGIGNRTNEQRLTEPSISRLIKDRMKQAGYDTHRLSAHSLRHTSVTILLEAGATIQEAQTHARHASPSTTEIYAHNLDQRKAHDEQRIYDFIFDRAADPAEKAADYIRKMPADKQAKALELLQAMAG